MDAPHRRRAVFCPPVVLLSPWHARLQINFLPISLRLRRRCCWTPPAAWARATFASMPPPRPPRVRRCESSHATRETPRDTSSAAMRGCAATSRAAVPLRYARRAACLVPARPPHGARGQSASRQGEGGCAGDARLGPGPEPVPTGPPWSAHAVPASGVPGSGERGARSAGFGWRGGAAGGQFVE